MERRIRKKLRLENYDYSRNGAYFVTICTKDKMCIFWEPQNKWNNSNEQDIQNVGAVIGRPHTKIRLSECGKHVKISLDNIHTHYPDIHVDKYVIMPNHIHIILRIDADLKTGGNDNDGRPMTAPTISQVINHMKGYVTRQIGFSPWQRSYNDHIIRNAREYAAYWQYIENNPVNWENDELFIKNTL